MARINTRGVVVGGLVAGLIINVSEYILNEPVLGARMVAALTAHNLPPVGGNAIAVFVILGFVLGLVLVPADGTDEDELMLAAADGGADDVELDGSSFQITCAPEALAAVREAVEAAGFPVESVELTMIPKTTVEVGDENAAKKILRLIDALEDNDDVQEVYANFDIPEQVMETVL